MDVSTSVTDTTPKKLQFTCDSSVNPGRIIYYICGSKSRGGKIAKSFPSFLSETTKPFPSSYSESIEIANRDKIIDKLIRDQSTVRQKLRSLVENAQTHSKQKTTDSE